VGLGVILTASDSVIRDETRPIGLALLRNSAPDDFCVMLPARRVLEWPNERTHFSQSKVASAACETWILYSLASRKS
jgi:hypothetical protein